MKSRVRPASSIILSALVLLTTSCGDEATSPLAESEATGQATAAAAELNGAEVLPFEASFGGVGIGFHVIDGAVEVRHVVDSMPADVAGIEVGDLIVSVDGISTEGLTASAFLELGRGEPGTTVTYELLADDGGTTVVTLEREPMEQSHRAHRRYIRQQKEFGGVGLSLTDREGIVQIDRVLPGLPAEQAGVQASDRIVAVDGRVIQGQPLIDVIGVIRGQVGTTVTIDVADASGATRQLEIERAAIVLPERHHRRHRHPDWAHEAAIRCAE